MRRVADLGARIGVHFRMNLPDRRILEGVVIPWFDANPAFSRVLFVGCDWYTLHYRELFGRSVLRTIDVDPQKARYGTKNHIVDGMENLSRHVDPESLDLVICSGVIGWGLNSAELAERAIDGCRVALRAEGMLVLGVDDVAERQPFPLQSIRALGAFDPVVFPPLSASRYAVPDCPFRNVFTFHARR
jgi:hypothetical protein